MASEDHATTPGHLLVPVVPLRDMCLFPEAHLSLGVVRPAVIEALEMAKRTGNRVIAIAQKESSATNPGPSGLYDLGTVAELASAGPIKTGSSAMDEGGQQVQLEALQRAHVVGMLGTTTLVAEVEPLDEGDAGNEWGPAVEALARYMHAHSELRTFLDEQRRSKGAMAWVNLACQHLPIAATARQKLLAADARERCLKISRGLDALLRKEQAS